MTENDRVKRMLEIRQETAKPRLKSSGHAGGRLRGQPRAGLLQFMAPTVQAAGPGAGAGADLPRNYS
jgi:hypothetical protein